MTQKIKILLIACITTLCLTMLSLKASISNKEKIEQIEKTIDSIRQREIYIDESTIDIILDEYRSLQQN